MQLESTVRLPRQVQRMKDNADAYERDRQARIAPVEQPEVVAPKAAEPPKPGRPDEFWTERGLPIPPADKASDPEYWMQRFLVLHGLNRKQAEDFHAQTAGSKDGTKKLKDRITELEAENASLKQPASMNVREHFPDKVVEELGEETLAGVIKPVMDLQKKFTEERAAEKRTEREDREKQEADKQQADAKAKQERLFAALDVQLPEWRGINAEDGWKLWLSQDNDDGIERQTVLNTLTQRGSVTGIVAMFKRYLKDAGRGQTPPITPSANGATHSEGQVAPVETEPPLTAAYIKRQYALRAQRRLTDAEFAAFEKRVDAQFGRR